MAKGVIKIPVSKKEASYLKSLLESEVFKLKGMNKIVKEPVIAETLESAEKLHSKINSAGYQLL
jgi:hypothetical protein